MRISDWSSDVCSSDLIGPRRLNDFSGNAFYRLTEASLGVQASGEVHKLNYLRSLADERDYTSYRGALRGFYRMSPFLNLYLQGYVNRRDFRQAARKSTRLNSSQYCPNSISTPTSKKKIK